MSWQDWRLLLEAGGLAIFMEIALRVLAFNKLLARLDAIDARAVKVKIAAASSRPACERAVDLAYRVLPLTHTCLKESLVLLQMLRGRGVTSRLCLGVRKDGDRFAAHAWVEHDPTPLEGIDDDEAYAPLPIPRGLPDHDLGKLRGPALFDRKHPSGARPACQKRQDAGACTEIEHDVACADGLIDRPPIPLEPLTSVGDQEPVILQDVAEVEHDRMKPATESLTEDVEIKVVGKSGQISLGKR